MNMKLVNSFKTYCLKVENTCQSFPRIYLEDLVRSYITFCSATMENFKNYWVAQKNTTNVGGKDTTVPNITKDIIPFLKCFFHFVKRKLMPKTCSCYVLEEQL
jgi:hypothetical protein